MKTLKDLWIKSRRLIRKVEDDKSCGKWCRMDGGYFVPNDKGHQKIRRITHTYNEMRKRVVDRWIEEGMMDAWMIEREFIGFDRPNYIARDYHIAYFLGQDMPIIK